MPFWVGVTRFEPSILGRALVCCPQLLLKNLLLHLAVWLDCVNISIVGSCSWLGNSQVQPIFNWAPFFEKNMGCWTWPMLIISDLYGLMFLSLLDELLAMSVSNRWTTQVWSNFAQTAFVWNLRNVWAKFVHTGIDRSPPVNLFMQDFYLKTNCFRN